MKLWHKILCEYYFGRKRVRPCQTQHLTPTANCQLFSFPLRCINSFVASNTSSVFGPRNLLSNSLPAVLWSIPISPLQTDKMREQTQLPWWQYGGWWDGAPVGCCRVSVGPRGGVAFSLWGWGEQLGWQDGKQRAHFDALRFGGRPGGRELVELPRTFHWK